MSNSSIAKTSVMEVSRCRWGLFFYSQKKCVNVMNHLALHRTEYEECGLSQLEIQLHCSRLATNWILDLYGFRAGGLESCF